MIYKNKFNLTGSTEQQELVKQALDQIYFPWERLHFPSEPVEIGWKDLNAAQVLGSRKHTGAIHGWINGRHYILGEMWPHSGELYIDNHLINYPEIARSTVSAEVAHDVDYFLPLTDDQRKRIMELMHPEGSDEHTWWEKIDYGAEYYSLVGESFMQAFTVAYSDIPFGDSSGFTHSISPAQAPALRQIIGIERTDVVTYKIYPPSTIYHRVTHRVATKKIPIYINNTSGFTPCKICKP